MERGLDVFVVEGIYTSIPRRRHCRCRARNQPDANPAGPGVGVAEVVARVVDPINNDWKGFITRVDAILDARDQVVVHGEYTGTFKATGRDIAAPVCAIYTVRDEAITERPE